MPKKKEPMETCKVLGTWKSIKPAGITEPGSASELRTGDWRSQRPIHILEKCTKYRVVKPSRRRCDCDNDANATHESLYPLP